MKSINKIWKMKKTHEGKKTFPYLDFDLFRQKNEHNSVILHATDLGKVSKVSSEPILSRSNAKKKVRCDKKKLESKNDIFIAIFHCFCRKRGKYG